ncbi:MAG: hypothetical protein WA790_17955 [Sulfitobacter sp.]
MIVLTLLIALTLLAVHLRVAPRRYLVHAARARNFPKNRHASRRVGSPMAYRDALGKAFSRKGRFYGEALGSSMVRYGIEDGDEFFGNYMPEKANLDELKALLSPEDIVVIDDIAAGSETGKRLRRISAIDETGTISFYPDHLGEPHTSRSVSKVVAIVTHVVS